MTISDMICQSDGRWLVLVERGSVSQSGVCKVKCSTVLGLFVCVLFRSGCNVSCL